jgi:hypothetical protein
VASARFDVPEVVAVDTEDFVPLEELVDDVATLDDPDVACEVVELPELVVPVALVALWVEPGSATAITPVASTPATPTPAVTAVSRLMPRRRSIQAGTGRSAGLTGISGSLPSLVARAGCWVPRLRSCNFEDAWSSAGSTLAFFSIASEPEGHGRRRPALRVGQAACRGTY